MSSIKKLPNLNGLRFIAAILVIVGHIELAKSHRNLSNLMDLAFFKNESGLLGVILFFVLSGFLITHLLIAELNKTGTISLLNFYMRRILRIWPLYFLILLLSLYIGYGTIFHESLLYGVLFTPNIFDALFHPYVISPQIWSIGVEEQFYLIWPLLFVTFYRKMNVYLWLGLFFIGYSFLPYFIGYYNNNISSLSYYHQIDSILYGAKFNSMALGCIIAFFFNKFPSQVNSIFYNRYFEILVFSLTFILVLAGFNLAYFKHEIFSILFACIILSLTNETSFFRPFLENKVIDYFGKISYGLYMFHFIVIHFVLNYTQSMIRVEGIVLESILYLSIIFFTFFISHLSYQYFEKPFLNLKSKFTF